MKNILKRVCTGFLALATVITILPAITTHAAEKQYWTESAERVGFIEQVMNDGSIKATFNEGYMKVEEKLLIVSTSTRLSKMATRYEQTQVRV